MNLIAMMYFLTLHAYNGERRVWQGVCEQTCGRVSLPCSLDEEAKAWRASSGPQYLYLRSRSHVRPGPSRPTQPRTTKPSALPAMERMGRAIRPLARP